MLVIPLCYIFIGEDTKVYLFSKNPDESTGSGFESPHKPYFLTFHAKKFYIFPPKNYTKNLKSLPLFEKIMDLRSNEPPYKI